jgi:hypothetical protein
LHKGSLEECRYYLILSRDLDYGSNDDIDDLSVEVSKLLNGYLGGIEKAKF